MVTVLTQNVSEILIKYAQGWTHGDKFHRVAIRHDNSVQTADCVAMHASLGLSIRSLQKEVFQSCHKINLLIRGFQGLCATLIFSAEKY